MWAEAPAGRAWAASQTAYTIQLDTNNDAIVAGTSNASDYPTTTGAFLSTKPGASGSVTNAIVTSLNSSGTALTGSTWVAGSGADTIYGMAVDARNNVYLTGSTKSSDFPVTTGAFQTTLPNSTSSGFVGELKADFSGVNYLTFLGGNTNDQGNAIVVDSVGQAFVGGYTSSSNFPFTKGSLWVGGSGSDGFLAGVNPLGRPSPLPCPCRAARQRPGQRLGAGPDARLPGFCRHDVVQQFQPEISPFQLNNAGGSGTSDAFLGQLSLNPFTAVHISLPRWGRQRFG